MNVGCIELRTSTTDLMGDKETRNRLKQASKTGNNRSLKGVNQCLDPAILIQPRSRVSLLARLFKE